MSRAISPKSGWIRAQTASASTNGCGTRAWCEPLSDAAALVQAGYVRVNAAKVTAQGHPVRAGDVVTLALARSVRVLKVEAFSDKRGGAPAALRLAAYLA